jgi:hypothetical protein
VNINHLFCSIFINFKLCYTGGDSDEDEDVENDEVDGTFIVLAVQTPEGGDAADSGSGSGSGRKSSSRKSESQYVKTLRGIFKGEDLQAAGRTVATLPRPTGGQIAMPMEIYIVSDPSSRQLRTLKKLHDSLPCCLSMLVPSLGNAKVTASNCVPSRESLRKIFFKDEADEEGAVDDYNAAYGGGGGDGGGGDGKKKKGEFYIAEQVASSRQQFVFPNPFHPDGYGTATSSPMSSSLVLDVPVGMRLLNSYRFGYKDKYVISFHFPVMALVLLFHDFVNSSADKYVIFVIFPSQYFE